MKIILTVTRRGTNPIVVYNNNITDKVVIWHQDTLTQELFNQLIAQHGRPDILVNSAHPVFDSQGIEYYYWPDDINTLVDPLVKQSPIHEYPTQYCFNFAVNKNTLNRYLLLKLVEWYGLTSYNYTWNGKNPSFNLQELLPEFDTLSPEVVGTVSEFVAHMVAPISKIQSKFFDIDADTYTTRDCLVMWDYKLNEIFGKSAVSLIAEPSGVEKTINFTEKTLFSIQALTFPIWVGGYGQADLWEQHGFDTFSDVIDHSYQYRETTLERCIYAFKDNLQILTDVDFAREQRDKHMNRLLHNREIMLPNLQEMFYKCFKKMPIELQESLKDMLEKEGVNYPLYNKLFQN